MRVQRSLLLVFLCLLAPALWAQMTPNAPVKNFRVPRFSESGFTQWVLQGGEGIYDSPAQVRVNDMALRVYSGDERMALEMTLDSPAATIRVQESRAYSEAPIEIVGANFKISGTGWTWEGEKKVIQVKSDARVEFSQALSETLTGEAVRGSDAKRTVIKSTGLRLTTTDEDYKFEFSKDVTVSSEEMSLKSEALMVLADAPEQKLPGAPEVAPDQLDSVRAVYAQGDVEIEQAGRRIRAGSAEFYPREERALLTKQPEIETAGAFINGERMESQEGLITIEGSSETGRAQMILVETGGLGIEGGTALAAQTIVLANSITMRELETDNEFVFEGKVEVLSGPLQVRSDLMTIRSKRVATAASEGESELRVGEVREIVAEGSVDIEQEGQRATADRVVFQPLDESALLTGSPKVTNGEAVLVGQRIELQPGSVLVTGTESERVEVRLPVLPDLGYRPEISPSTGGETEEDPEVPEPEASPTTVSSLRLRMTEGPEQTTFRFTESVAVDGTNLEATARQLDVVAEKREGADAADPSVSTGNLAVERIVATGDVVIMQEGRVATSETATILPDEGKVVLEGNAEVTDSRGKVTGHRLTLLQGERRALIEGGGPENRRATISLPELPSGNL